MDINTRLFVFARDVATREEVKEYIDSYIKEQILQRAFAKQEIKDLVEAQDVINGIFNNMAYEVKSLLPSDYVNENE